MITVVVDAATRSKLRNLHEAMQFTDENGRLLGRFEPAGENARRVPQISDAEIARRLQQGGGRPLAEIMAALEKRG
jgi:hypothetical protein